ncbi:hypothetical protein EB796_019872 [Bugula neritina]|uniref:Ig-like domain-containing protein n=1 Tax=Bugula neritina TaxID=10212 RepID=A0A7J7J824_BUGNE|nr:hypothetical protein EB796_019872 [Bugula neritina]
MSFTTKSFLLIILSSAIFNLETTEASLHLTAEVDQLNYNVGGSATFTCTINSDEFLGFGLEIEWYKQQDDEFVLVGRYQNTILSPFEDTKYAVSAPAPSPRTKTISFILQIKSLYFS